MIEDFKNHIPPEIAQRSGKVFYSGRAAFSGDRPLYILGYNPGGNPLAPANAEETVAAHTQKVLRDPQPNWSAYRNESWEGGQAGRRPLQRRMRALLEQLQVDPGAVPASNIIFVRSRGADDSAQESKELQERCWPFHQAVIAQLRVQVILCLGEKAAQVVKEKTAAHTPLKTFMDESGVPNVCFSNEAGLKVIRVTHPSYRYWTLPPRALVNFVKRAVQSGSPPLAEAGRR